MHVNQAEINIRHWAETKASAVSFTNTPVIVEYIWNPGGFVNQSYKLSDGEHSYHIKFAKEPQDLEKWARVSCRLTEKYKSPALITEVNEPLIPGFPYGLVFEFIEGIPLSEISHSNHYRMALLETIRNLHKDSVLKRKLGSSETNLTCADAFRKEYISRFEEDLLIIENHKGDLPFVDEALIRFFHQEVNRLRQEVGDASFFQVEADAVVHNDLNDNNILVQKQGDCSIIDWDGLTANGDAAMDFSVFLWPVYQTESWPVFKEEVRKLSGQAVIERMDLYFRAALLDEVIDPLADYIEAKGVPEVKEKAQKRAYAIHSKALTEYIKTY